MSIPLDRLYDYIEQIAERIFKDQLTIYRFYPHGSKRIEDLKSLRKSTQYKCFLCPEMFCNDQEPLNYELYQNVCHPHGFAAPPDLAEILKKQGITFPSFNFRGQITNIWDRSILLHSEQRSADLDRYIVAQFISAYYWSHAIIALDWFRYAEHIIQHKQVSKTFLIYNRAWSNTREYRLRFAELLIHLNLQEHCKTSINPIEPELGIHYDSHQFKNPVWRPQTVLENFFPISTAHSNYSADFDIEDYEATDIEVVLETLFDDGRLHLTEKSLRPIACAQPFILAGTHSSLEYLRSYGFKTFGDVWDESYDLVEDPAERLIQIAELMKQISCWGPTREKKLAEAQAIADYNRQYFFSQKFFNLVNNELETNLTKAFTELENTNTSSHYLKRREMFELDPVLSKIAKQNKSSEIRDLMFKRAQEYNMRSLN